MQLSIAVLLYRLYKELTTWWCCWVRTRYLLLLCDLSYMLAPITVPYLQFIPIASWNQHATPHQVITTEHWRAVWSTQCQAKMAGWNSFSYKCTWLSTLSNLSRIVMQPPPSFLCCPAIATFTPSIQDNLGPPRTHPLLTSTIITLLAIWYSLIFSTFTNPISVLSDLLYSLSKD